MELKVLFLSALILSGCAVTRPLPEDELFLTRKYVGTYQDHRITKERFGDPSILWVKTSQDSIFGKIQAYSRTCDFVKGDRLYIRRIFLRAGIEGYWIFQIESESKSYRLRSFEFENKVLIQGLL